MAFLKINGFHTGTTGRSNGIGDFLREVDAAGVPFFAYCADGTTSLVDAQEIMRNSDVPHNAVFRRTTFPHNQGEHSVPDYNESPQEAARKQWISHRDRWPKELDPSLIYGETVNELRKEVEWADWIGEFCYHTGLLALQNGFKWCGPAYSTGTPDEGAWETPGMLRYLDLCQQHPDRLAISLHEYSLSTKDILIGDGKLVGRFRLLIDACKKHNIKPPDIFFTEWGWTERNIPRVRTAKKHILEAGKLYAQYPAIKGAAIWALSGGWGKLDRNTHRLMEPLKQLLIETRYPDPLPTDPVDEEVASPTGPGQPREEYNREYLVVPPDASLEEWLAICRNAYGLKQTVGFSYDDAGSGDLARKTAILYDIPQEKWTEYMDWYAQHYPQTNVTFRDMPES
jgi:hypothetical protein